VTSRIPWSLIARIASLPKIDRASSPGNRRGSLLLGDPATCAIDHPEATPTLPAEYYRRKAAEARQTAEGVTTRAVKERLISLARDFDRLADAADKAEQAADAPSRVIRNR